MLSPASRAAWVWWGWACTFALVAVSLVVMSAAPTLQRDFECYHRAAERVSHGENPYVVDDLGLWHTYRYTPAFAYLMIPFAQLEHAWAARVWFVLNLLMLAGCCLLGLYLVLGSKLRSAEAAALALVALVVCSFPNCSNLFQGQSGLAMALACLGWAACRRTGRNFAGGALLAAACFLKVAPVVLVPYLVLRRDWRGLAGVALGGLFLALLPAPWVGFEGTVRMSRAWLDHLNATQFPGSNYRLGNHGLMGVLARTPTISNSVHCYSPENLAALVKVFPVVVAGLGAMLYALIAWRAWRARPSAGGASAGATRESEVLRENADLSLLFIFMTLTNPCAWLCNFSVLVLPCLLLARQAYRRQFAWRHCTLGLVLTAMAWGWPVLVVCANLMRNWINRSDLSFVEVVKGKTDTDWWFEIWVLQGANFWVALYVGAMCWVISRPRRTLRDQPGGSAVHEARSATKGALPSLPTGYTAS